jgi:NAD(P)H-flavin reductase
MENPKDSTKLWLLFANKTEEDILLKNRLDRFAADPSGKFQLHYLLSQVCIILQIFERIICMCY